MGWAAATRRTAARPAHRPVWPDRRRGLPGCRGRPSGCGVSAGCGEPVARRVPAGCPTPDLRSSRRTAHPRRIREAVHRRIREAHRRRTRAARSRRVREAGPPRPDLRSPRTTGRHACSSGRATAPGALRLPAAPLGGRRHRPEPLGRPEASRWRPEAPRHRSPAPPGRRGSLHHPLQPAHDPLRRGPAHRVLDQQPLQYGRQFARAGRRCGLLAEERGQGGVVAVPVEGAAALDGGVQRGAQGEQVRGGRGRFATRALGGEIAGCAEDAGGGGEPRLAGLRHERDAVVGEQHARVGVARSVRRQKDVGRFHIPVQDADAVSGGERVEDAEPDAGHLGGRQRTRTPYDRLEVDRVRHVLDDDPGQPLVHHHVVHRRHMRMSAQAGRVPGLAAGARDALGGLTRVHRHVRKGDLLHRDFAGQLLVVREPYAAHAARAERPQQPVPPVDDPAFAVVRCLPRHRASPRQRASPRTRGTCLSKVASHLPLTGALFGSNPARSGTGASGARARPSRDARRRERTGLIGGGRAPAGSRQAPTGDGREDGTLVPPRVAALRPAR